MSEKKKGLQELEWAIAHFPVLGHDTGDSIAIRRAWEAWPWRAPRGATRPSWRIRARHDTAQLGCDTTSSRAWHGPAHAAWGFVSRQGGRACES